MFLRRERRDDLPLYDAASPAPTIGDIARSLRIARIRQGLRIEDVSARTGVPADRLRALEVGVVGRHGEELATLRAVRRYAALVGLPGDRYVLTLVDRWPAKAVVDEVTASATSPIPSVDADTGTQPAVPATGIGQTARAEQVTPEPLTEQVTPEPAVGEQPTGPVSAVPPFVVPIPSTGSISATSGPPGGSPAIVVRRRRTSIGLRLLVSVLVLALLAGIAGLVIHQVRPQWLRSIGITRATAPLAAPPSPAGDRPAAPGTTAPQTATPVTSGLPAVPVIARASTTSSGTVFDVHEPSFLIRVTAAGHPCWIQVTRPGTSSPVFSGTLQSGQAKSFTVRTSLSVELGSVAGRLSLSSTGRSIGSYVPTAAPYTVTYRTAVT